ncbi:hypothetical protein BX616_009120 [Lobosporangium transversale]|uniref:F-box domain-containing protein n=1 Tax=Lobosporangium transversale TaxID=64571 RepID=A0A1Y2GER6_9FUNG|nr:hypothetical protein BCR41DRAFT_373091 [Lobosporangium transversale]KAF9914026.1 hypothetical protein BX616_009120 [Lobosporangium transversale]ORZ08791.1 hypothetical protein BCR41DRAFT_373091 [Lobosporangium transversale]|eukprot:XP_021878574.1 hypothetical protein BCR41DRAFT_373091 [Lobosporangium transversale]
MAMVSQSSIDNPYLRKLRPRITRDCLKIDPTIKKVHQDTVFSIPELMSMITSYLTQKELRALIRVCKSWNNIWAPHLYATVTLHKYRRSHKYPSLHVYGEYIKGLRLQSIIMNSILHILDHTPNLQSLSLEWWTASMDLRKITAMAPQLRTLQFYSYRISTQPSGYTIAAAATLPNLENLIWRGNIVRLDDLLLVLKSCSKLKSLVLLSVTIVDKPSISEDTEQMTVNTNHSSIAIAADDDWRNLALRSITLDTVSLGPTEISWVELKDPHPTLRQIFLRLPNLTHIRYSSMRKLTTASWDFILKGRSGLQCVAIHRPFAIINTGEKIIMALATNCPDLKELNIDFISDATDESLATLMQNARRLEKVSAKQTRFGPLAMKALINTPTGNSPTNTITAAHMAFINNSATPSPVYNLVELDFQHCLQVTDTVAALVMENCIRLRKLNLSQTCAGTIELYQGTKPWSVASTLQVLHIEVQPRGYQGPTPGQAWNNQEHENITHYTPEEQSVIRERLKTLRSLKTLEMSGRAMELTLLEDFSFAPNLRRAILAILFRARANHNDFKLVRARVLEWGAAVFPGWILQAGSGFSNFGPLFMLGAFAEKEFVY